VRRHEGVSDTFVVDEDGVLLADGTAGEDRRFTEPELHAEVLAAIASSPGEPFLFAHDEHLDTALPLMLGDERIGVVVVEYSLAEVRAEAVRAQRTGLVLGLAFTGLAGLAVALLAVRLTRALVRLTDFARVAAEDHLPRVLAAVRQGRPVEPHLLAAPAEVGNGREARRLADALGTYGSVVNGMAGDLARLLRETDARFASAFEGSAVGMAILDPEDGRPVAVNDALCRLLGRSRADLLAASLPTLVHAADRPVYDARLAALLEGSAPVRPWSSATCAGTARWSGRWPAPRSTATRTAPCAPCSCSSSTPRRASGPRATWYGWPTTTSSPSCPTAPTCSSGSSGR
jgi:PAS domain S-box-containing protein